jgi:hypothetical protein
MKAICHSFRCAAPEGWSVRRYPGLNSCWRRRRHRPRVAWLPERFTATSCVDGGAAILVAAVMDAHTSVSLGKSAE